GCCPYAVRAPLPAAYDPTSSHGGPMLVVTTNDIPGWEIRQVCGEVFGLTVRSRNAISQMGAGFKSLMGGELKGMTSNLVNSRNEVMGRMIDEARNRGANAVT